jgi:hypothetical protein
LLKPAFNLRTCYVLFVFCFGCYITQLIRKFFFDLLHIILYNVTKVTRAAENGFCIAFFDMVDFATKTFPVTRSLIRAHPWLIIFAPLLASLAPWRLNKSLCLRVSAVNSIVSRFSHFTMCSICSVAADRPPSFGCSWLGLWLNQPLRLRVSAVNSVWPVFRQTGKRPVLGGQPIENSNFGHLGHVWSSLVIFGHLRMGEPLMKRL